MQQNRSAGQSLVTTLAPKVRFVAYPAPAERHRTLEGPVRAALDLADIVIAVLRPNASAVTFEKIGTHRQSELVAMVMRGVAPLSAAAHARAALGEIG